MQLYCVFKYMFCWLKIYGTIQFFLFCCERWEAIANFLKIHIADSNRSAKDVLAKAKQLQKNGKRFRCFVWIIVWCYMAEVCLQFQCTVV